jgi:protein-S-isoprenylcysteine O-methyltransferase Ste14
LTLELRVPPPVVTALCALLMWLIGEAVPAADFHLPAGRWIALALAASGVAMGAAAALQFRAAKTTIHPLRPEESSALVVRGLFRFTRNPMYLGMLLVLAAWALCVANAAALVVLPLHVAYLNRFQIAPEERVLQARFGAAFEGYRRAVRRWI